MREFTVTVNLTYDDHGGRHTDCRITFDPDGGTPAAVAMDAAAMLAGFAVFAVVGAGGNRDVALADMIGKMLTARTSEVPAGQSEDGMSGGR